MLLFLSFSVSRRIRLSEAFCIFFNQLSGHHDHMTASCAFQPEIRAYPENLPFLAAAGMWFFQFYDISHFIYHASASFRFFRILSISCSSASENGSAQSAPRLLSSCSQLLAPTSTVVTSGRLKIQESAICASV